VVSGSKRITNKLANDVTIRLILGCGEVGREKSIARTEDVATKSLNRDEGEEVTQMMQRLRLMSISRNQPEGCRKVPCVIWYCTIKHKCDVE
jgi:hypothetical protein